MHEPGDVGAGHEMAEPALALLELDVAQIVSVVMHQVERPQHEVVLDALVDMFVERLKAGRVHQLGVDNEGASERRERGGEVGKALRSVGAIARVERDVPTGLVDLHPVSVELHLVTPVRALG